MKKLKTGRILKLVIALSWKDIFPERVEKRDVIDFLTGIDPDTLLLTICAINQSFASKESLSFPVVSQKGSTPKN